MLGCSELLLILFVIGIPLLIPAIFYLLTLQKALNRCAPESRAMSPGLVWLMFIPLFNMVWHFIIVSNISKSLHSEFVKRNLQEDPNPGQGIGLAMCILQVVSIIPIVGFFTGIACFICWIIYWVKIAGFSAKLQVSWGL